MNIYIELEVTNREFESRLLLAFEAAYRNFNVYIAYRKDIQDAALNSKISPGIIHMKDANGTSDQIQIYDKLKKLGFKITAQDEEGGFVYDNYSVFADGRMTDGLSFRFIDYLFCWSKREKDYLFEKYKNLNTKFLETGSPRFDLNKKKFVKEYKNDFYQKYKIKKKFILISGLSFPLSLRRFADRIVIDSLMVKKEDRDAQENKAYLGEAESILSTRAFISLIRFLSKNLDDYDIVLRPHPGTLKGDWEKIIGKDTNVKIISDGNISDFIINSELLIQKNCSSAFEATILGKKVITFFPNLLIKDNEKLYDFLNNLGVIASSKEKVLELIKDISNFEYPNINKNEINNRISFLFDDSLSFLKIVNCWEKIRNSFDSNKNIKGFTRRYHQYYKLKIKKLIKKIFFQPQTNVNVHDNKLKNFNYKTLEENKKKFIKNYNLKYIDALKVDIIEDKILKVSK